MELKESESVSRSVVSDSLQPRGYSSPPGSSVHGILQEYWSGLLFLSPGDLPTQGLNLGLLHCGKILTI